MLAIGYKKRHFFFLKTLVPSIIMGWWDVWEGPGAWDPRVADIHCDFDLVHELVGCRYETRFWDRQLHDFPLNSRSSRNSLQLPARPHYDSPPHPKMLLISYQSQDLSDFQQFHPLAMKPRGGFTSSSWSTSSSRRRLSSEEPHLCRAILWQPSICIHKSCTRLFGS